MAEEYSSWAMHNPWIVLLSLLTPTTESVCEKSQQKKSRRCLIGPLHDLDVAGQTAGKLCTFISLAANLHGLVSVWLGGDLSPASEAQNHTCRAVESDYWNGSMSFGTLFSIRVDWFLPLGSPLSLCWKVPIEKICGYKSTWWRPLTCILGNVHGTKLFFALFPVSLFWSRPTVLSTYNGHNAHSFIFHVYFSHVTHVKCPWVLERHCTNTFTQIHKIIRIKPIPIHRLF